MKCCTADCIKSKDCKWHVINNTDPDDYDIQDWSTYSVNNRYFCGAKGKYKLFLEVKNVK